MYEVFGRANLYAKGLGNRLGWVVGPQGRWKGPGGRAAYLDVPMRYSVSTRCRALGAGITSVMGGSSNLPYIDLHRVEVSCADSCQNTGVKW